MEQAKPCLLEPVMKVEIEAPDEFAGTLMGDLNGRRGRVQGMESKGRTTVINAQVPMAEMLTYGTLLTSMTQGKGSYRMEMDHYDIVPQLVADKILANAKRPVEEEEEEPVSRSGGLQLFTVCFGSKSNPRLFSVNSRTAADFFFACRYGSRACWLQDCRLAMCARSACGLRRGVGGR